MRPIDRRVKTELDKALVSMDAALSAEVVSELLEDFMQREKWFTVIHSRGYF